MIKTDPLHALTSRTVSPACAQVRAAPAHDIGPSCLSRTQVSTARPVPTAQDPCSSACAQVRAKPARAQVVLSGP